MGTNTMTISKPKPKAKSGSAEGGQTTTSGYTMPSGWTTALAVAVGTIGSATVVQKYPGFYTIFEREAKAADASGAGAVEAREGFDTRWMAALALAGIGYGVGTRKFKYAKTVGKLMAALGAGFGLSWASDKVRGMEWAQPKGVASGEKGVASGEIGAGEIDTGRIYLEDTDSGALGVGRRLQATKKEIGQLRAKRERLEDVVQHRLENRQAHGKRLTPQQQAYLAREQAEDARQAARRPRQLQSQADWVRVPVEAVRPGFLARLGA